MSVREAEGPSLARYTDRVAVARGGAAIVHRAVDSRTKARVAIKRCVEIEGARADAVTREGALLSVIAHPALAEYVEHGLDEGYAYVVTRWIDGESLEERRARAPLSSAELVALARRVASALAALHGAGFVHGDVSPSNVLLEGREPARAVLIDPSTHGFVTPEFAAPEALHGALSSPAGDLYSLGALLVASGAEQCDKPAIAALAKALCDERSSRRPDANAVIAELDRIELSHDALPRGSSRAETRSKLISTPLRGRERELAWLDAERARCDAEGPRLVILRSAIGQGKSSLLRHWQNRRPFAERSLWANARGVGAPFALLESLLDNALSAHSDHADPALALASRCAQSPSEIAAIAALFAEVQRRPRPGAIPPIVMVAHSDPSMMLAQLEWAFGRLFAVELALGPLTVVIDDAHECDPTSSRVLSGVARRARGPLMLIWSGRSADERDPLAAMARASLVLAPLDAAASEQMARDLWPSASELSLRSIVERAEGSPLHIEQLARQQASDSAPVTEVVRRRVEARLPIERSVLAAAALLGASFSATAARAVCADVASAGAIELAIEQLSNAGFLRSLDDGSLSFANALVRDAALESARSSDERLRARALRWLSAKGEDDVALAVLADSTGERDVAAMRYLGAARRAAMGGDFASATSYAQSGLRCSTAPAVSAALEAVRANALGWMGRWREASEGAQRALAGVERGSDDWARAASARCFALFELGEIDASLRALDELLSVEPTPRTFDLLAWAYSAMAFALSASFADRTMCERLVRASSELARKAQTARVSGAAARVRADFYRAIEADLGRAVEHITEAERLLHEAGDELGAIYTRGLHARYRFIAGDWQRSLALCEEGLEIAERLRANSVLLYLRASRADLLLRVHRTTEALAEALAVLETPGVSARTAIRTQAHRVAAEAHLDLGDVDEAVQSAAHAVAATKSDSTDRACAYVVLAMARREAGAIDAAIDAAREAERVVSAARPIVTDDYGAAATLALALADKGAIDEARAALALAEQRLARWLSLAGPLAESMERSSIAARRTAQARAAVTAASGANRRSRNPSR
ncbi:MAG: protein kinase [Polyangiales bacterium]